MSGLKEWWWHSQRIIRYPWATSENSPSLPQPRASTPHNKILITKRNPNKYETFIHPSYSLPKYDEKWLCSVGNCLGFHIQRYLEQFNKFTDSSFSRQTSKYIKLLSPDSQKRFYQKNPQNESSSQKPLPKLLYIQNPIVWLTNKLDFRFLRLSWDPSFTETEFTRGTRQAVSTVTQMISKNMFDSMKPLLTRNALLNLRRDVEILWADEVRRNIGLWPEDVQLVIPRKLYFRHSSDPLSLNAPQTPKFLESPLHHPSVVATSKKIDEKRFCDIDVLFIGLKRLESQHNPPLIYVDIIARFHRNYTEGMVPDWTISAFKVRRFYVIPQKN